MNYSFLYDVTLQLQNLVFFPTNFGSLFFSIFIFKKQLIFFLTQDRRFFFSAGTNQYLADISKESKMREHLTKKGPLTLALIG